MGTLLMDLTEYTDEELDDLRVQVITEQERRAVITTAAQQAEALNQRYVQAIGRKPGDPYEEPSGYHDAYAKDWTVTHEGRTYIALRDGARGEPGVDTADWREQTDEVQAWYPVHAGNEWPEGAVVTHDGHTWRNELGRPNGFMPGQNGSGWTQLD